MQEATLQLADNTLLKIFVDDVEAFAQTIVDSPGRVAVGLSGVEVPTVFREHDKVQQCTLTLADGTQLFCAMLEDDISEASSKSALIVDCEEVFLDEMLHLVTIEKLLDSRMLAVSTVVNNLPDKRRRLDLHRNYLKLKSAYIAALEAMLHGKFRD